MLGLYIYNGCFLRLCSKNSYSHVTLPSSYATLSVVTIVTVAGNSSLNRDYLAYSVYMALSDHASRPLISVGMFLSTPTSKYITLWEQINSLSGFSNSQS